MNKIIFSIFAILLLIPYSPISFSVENTKQDSIVEQASKTNTRKTASNDNLEKIKVTGSRIQRIDIEGASPIVIYNKEDLENSGYSSAGDFLRDSTVAHFGVSRERAGSSTSGESFTSLKGETSLILINGLRVAEDPDGGAVDLNLIPIYAIERVEILKDGASAIYGSDAIGGVINFITKKDFSGLELHAQTAPTVYEPEKSDWYKGGLRGDLATVFGGKYSKGSYIGSFHFRAQDSVENHERKWTAESSSYTSPYWILDGNVDPKCPKATAAGCEFNLAKYSTRLPRYAQLYAFFQGDYNLGETKLYTQLLTSYKNNKWAYAPIPGTLEISRGTLRYRFMEAGQRDTTFNNFTGDLTVGAKGYLSSTWDYDSSLKLAHIKKTQKQEGLLLIKELKEAIDSGVYDPFVDDPTKRDLSKAKHTANSNSDSSLLLYSLDFSGETNFIDLATGFQAYFKNYDQIDDEQSKAGKVLSKAGGDGYGDRYVMSYYLEGVKYLSDTLEIQLANRIDYYNDSVYPEKQSEINSEEPIDTKELKRESVNRWTTNPKLAFRFKPSSHFLLRGSIGTAFVAPSLGSLNQTTSEGYPSVFDTVACYNELKSKNAFNKVYETLPDKSEAEKEALLKDFLIEQKDVIEQELPGEVKTALKELSESFAKQDYCQYIQVSTHYQGNKNLKETKALVSSLGTHIQITDDHSLTMDFWYIRKSGIPSSGIGKKTFDAELKYGQDYVTEKSDKGITIQRTDTAFNPIAPNRGIKTRLLNLASSQISGMDLSWDSSISPSQLNGSFYFKDSFSYIFSASSEAFPGMGYVDIIGKWGAPQWRNTAMLGWRNEKHNISLTAHTVSSFAKLSSELENLPMYTRLDLDYQFIINPKATFKFGWSNLFSSTPPIDKDAFPNQIDHDIFESRGPFFFAGIKYKI